MGSPNQGNIAIKVTIAISDTPRPALTISFVGRLHGAAAIAFGGVPTGKQNAWEHAKAAGIIRYIGCQPALIHISDNTGKITLATATLLENSVKTEANIEANTITENLGNCAKPPKCNAINLLIPELLDPSAKAKPPPNKKIRPHGNFCWATFQVIRGADGAVGLLVGSLLKK